MRVSTRGKRKRAESEDGNGEKECKEAKRNKPRAGRWRQTAGDARYGSGMEGESGDKISELL